MIIIINKTRLIIISYHCAKKGISRFVTEHVPNSGQGCPSSVNALRCKGASPVENVDPSVLPGFVVKNVVEELVLVVPEDGYLLFRGLA